MRLTGIQPFLGSRSLLFRGAAAALFPPSRSTTNTTAPSKAHNTAVHCAGGLLFTRPHFTHHPSRGMHAAANGAAGGGLIATLEPTCVTPALKAAEAALLAKLEHGAAGCHADYAALEALQDDLVRRCTFAAALENRELNRYTDVLPYDHSRVRLQQVAPGETDYLNASLLTSNPPAATADGAAAAAAEVAAAAAAGETVPWNYIASQGPLDHTRERFWHCVYEQNCSAIVMVTNCVERNLRKCARYFPTRPGTKKTFGTYAVKTAAAEEVCADLCRRTLMVAPTYRAGERHTLEHYHYEAWPDHGVPASPLPLLRVCEHLLQTGAHARPILVHCSAGIGRSGVFCVLDIITRRLRQLHVEDVQGGAQAVDCAALVAHMRSQRMGMVQTRDQYVFCHTALLHFVRQLDGRHQQQQLPQQET